MRTHTITLMSSTTGIWRAVALAIVATSSIATVTAATQDIAQS